MSQGEPLIIDDDNKDSDHDGDHLQATGVDVNPPTTVETSNSAGTNDKDQTNVIIDNQPSMLQEQTNTESSIHHRSDTEPREEVILKENDEVLKSSLENLNSKSGDSLETDGEKQAEADPKSEVDNGKGSSVKLDPELTSKTSDPKNEEMALEEQSAGPGDSEEASKSNSLPSEQLKPEVQDENGAVSSSQLDDGNGIVSTVKSQPELSLNKSNSNSNNEETIVEEKSVGDTEEASKSNSPTSDQLNDPPKNEKEAETGSKSGDDDGTASDVIGQPANNVIITDESTSDSKPDNFNAANLNSPIEKDLNENYKLCTKIFEEDFCLSHKPELKAHLEGLVDSSFSDTTSNLNDVNNDLISHSNNNNSNNTDGYGWLFFLFLLFSLLALIFRKTIIGWIIAKKKQSKNGSSSNYTRLQMQEGTLNENGDIELGRSSSNASTTNTSDYPSCIQKLIKMERKMSADGEQVGRLAAKNDNDSVGSGWDEDDDGDVRWDWNENDD